MQRQLHVPATYQNDLDPRKRPIRRFCIRYDRYYARIAADNVNTGKQEVRRVPLEDSPAEMVRLGLGAEIVDHRLGRLGNYHKSRAVDLNVHALWP